MPCYPHFTGFVKTCRIKQAINSVSKLHTGAKQSLSSFLTSAEFKGYNHIRKLPIEEHQHKVVIETEGKDANQGRKLPSYTIVGKKYIDSVKLFYEYFKSIEEMRGAELNTFICIWRGDTAEAYKYFKKTRECVAEHLEIFREIVVEEIPSKLYNMMMSGAAPGLTEGQYLDLSKNLCGKVCLLEEIVLAFMNIKIVKMMGEISAFTMHKEIRVFG